MQICIMKKTDLKFDWPLVGNKHIIEFLSRSIINGNIAQGYIFSGPDNLGKTRMANYFAQALLCDNQRSGEGELPCYGCASCRQFLHMSHRTKVPDTGQENIIHGDFHLVKRPKDKKNISVNEIRDLIHALGMSPLFNSYKIGIVKHAEAMSEEAFNSLLKTLEEPKERVVIILLTTRTEVLPATIVSRCQILDYRLVPADTIYDYLIKEYNASRSAAKDLSRMCLGRPALAVKMLQNQEFMAKYTRRADAFIDFFSTDINTRLNRVEELLGKESKGQESVKLTERIIEIWEALVRDLILLEFGHKNLVHYQSKIKELEKIVSALKSGQISALATRLSQAREFLRANVAPRTVLENVAINI